MHPLLYVAVLCLGFIIAFALYEMYGGEVDGGSEGNDSPFKRRRFLLDSNAEFGLFKVLVELYGDKYYIFPQVHYSHLLEVSKHDWKESRRQMAKLERKSADFVLCKKDDVSPQLVIELDGPTHKTHSRTMERDEFINDILEAAGLPCVRIAVGPYTPESIKEVVDAALAGNHDKKD